MKTMIIFCSVLVAFAATGTVYIYSEKWASCSLLSLFQGASQRECLYFDSVEAWGQLGDFFGGVLNPIIGVVTVILIMVTLIHNYQAMQQTLREVQRQTTAQEHAQLTQNFTSVLGVIREEISDVKKSGRSIKGLSRSYVNSVMNAKYIDADGLLGSLSKYRITMTKSINSIIQFVSYETDENKHKQLVSLCLVYIPFEVFIATLAVTKFNDFDNENHSIENLNMFVYFVLKFVPISNMTEICKKEIKRIENMII